MNPIVEMLTKFSPMGQAIQQASGVANALQGGNALGAISQSDPRMKQVMDYINSHGGNAEQAFYQMAKEKGYDPTQILNQVRGMMK